MTGTPQAASSSYGSLVVEKLSSFPFEKILETQPAGNTELSEGEERVLCRFLFEIDKENNKKSAGFATFHQDERGRLVRINEYDGDNLLTAVRIIGYKNGAEQIRVTSYDRDGNVTSDE